MLKVLKFFLLCLLPTLKGSSKIALLSSLPHVYTRFRKWSTQIDDLSVSFQRRGVGQGNHRSFQKFENINGNCNFSANFIICLTIFGLFRDNFAIYFQNPEIMQLSWAQKFNKFLRFCLLTCLGFENIHLREPVKRYFNLPLFTKISVTLEFWEFL